MPVSATEILPTAGTGRRVSALGTGAEDGLTSQLPGWPAAGVLEIVVGPVLGVLVEHAARQIAVAMVAVVIQPRLVSCWGRAVFVMSISARYLWPG
jgi:hypothetical protein